MIIGIEGTGSQDWDQTEFRRSFVRLILEQGVDQEKYYFIGPNNPGSDGDQIIRGAWQVLKQRGIQSSRVVLVGYSRGAAYCMKLADMWGREFTGLKVECLVMFDSVARNNYNTSTLGGTIAQFGGWKAVDIPEDVPSSVSVCLHAVRNPAAGSRAGFGNVGLNVNSKKQTKMHIRQDFFCSHGAMGGTSYDALNEEGDVNALKAYMPAGVAQAASGAGFDSNAILNSTFPQDPRYAKSKFPVPSANQDHSGRAQIGMWMWPLLKQYGVVSAAGRYDVNAPPLNGVPKPGVAVKVG
jgi:hypothetical protein